MNPDSLLLLMWSAQQQHQAEVRADSKAISTKLETMEKALILRLEAIETARRALIFNVLKALAGHWQTIAIIALFVLGALGILKPQTIADIKKLLL